MGSPRIASAADDALIIEGRKKGLRWEEIGAVLGVGRSWVRERGRRIGAVLHLVTLLPEVVEVARDPEPLPPGDPRTWGAIIAGTCLEGSPYPDVRARG